MKKISAQKGLSLKTFGKRYATKNLFKNGYKNYWLKNRRVPKIGR